MQMNRSIIIDLLPAYFSGEASPETCSLVEEYFRQDPDFERIARRASRSLNNQKKAAAALQELSTRGESQEEKELKHAGTMKRSRNIMLGFSMFYSLVPLIFTVRQGHLAWVMIRDNPQMGIMFWVYALLCWIGFFVIHNKLKPVRL